MRTRPATLPIRPRPCDESKITVPASARETVVIQRRFAPEDAATVLASTREDEVVYNAEDGSLVLIQFLRQTASS